MLPYATWGRASRSAVVAQPLPPSHSCTYDACKRACKRANSCIGQAWVRPRGQPHLTERVVDVLRGRDAVVAVKHAEEAVLRGLLQPASPVQAHATFTSSSTRPGSPPCSDRKGACSSFGRPPDLEIHSCRASLPLLKGGCNCPHLSDVRVEEVVVGPASSPSMLFLQARHSR